ncbi:MAG TPA: sugar ABC transporter substrate-binding protein [Candidatus Lumbricidophila sp.]|nr:sugar ABC transporter substrate-binding protein [Candidatus Lumbricidophila sp.]
MTKPSRLVRGALAVGAAALLAATVGCAQAKSAESTAATNEKVTLKFWAWVPGIEDAVALWNKSHPNIQVDFTKISGKDVNDLGTKADAGTAPDVAQVSGGALPTLAINKQVQDITKYLPNGSKDYVPSAWSAVTFGDKAYAVPQDIAPVGLMYRKDIFDKYGIQAPKTWDDYYLAAKKLHEADPNVYLDCFAANDLALFWQQLYQAGGSQFGTTGDAWTVGIDSDKAMAVAARWQKLIDDKLVYTQQGQTPAYWADINSGKLASMIYANWEAPILAENAPALKGKWAVAPMPSDNGKGADVGGSVNVVVKGSKHPQQAAEFLNWLNSDPGSLEILISKGGLFPAAKAGFDSPALKKPSEYFGGQQINEVFTKSAETAPQVTYGPAGGALGTAMGDGWAKVGTGEMKIADVLKATGTATRDALKKMGLTVQ